MNELDPTSREPAQRHTLQPLFFGPDGLRAGWSLLLFFAILGPLAAMLIVGSQKLRHRPATAQTQPRVAQPSEARPAGPGKVMIAEGAQLALVLLATFLMSRIERRPMAAYGIGPTPGGLGQLAAGAFWGVTLLSLLILVLVFTHHLVFDGRLLHGVYALHFGAVWLLGFLLVGLLEEYLVRGYLQFTLARGLAGIYATLRSASSLAEQHAVGFWLAAVFFSIIFGLGHRSNPGESPIGLLSAGLAGLVFVFSLWRTGSLLWAIGFHTTWDWAQSFLYGVADSGTTVQGHLFATHPVGTPLLSGGTTGPEGSLFILPVLALAACVIVVTLPRRVQAAPLQ